MAHFQGSIGLERGQNCSQWAQNGRILLVCAPQMVQDFCVLEKHVFDPSLTHFWSQSSPFPKHFVTLEGQKWLTMGSKWACFTCLGTPNAVGSFLKKHIFNPFLTHCWSQKQPTFKAFWDFRRAKTGEDRLKTGQKHLFWHPMWCRIIFEKSHFFRTYLEPTLTSSNPLSRAVLQEKGHDRFFVFFPRQLGPNIQSWLGLGSPSWWNHRAGGTSLGFITLFRV